MAADDRDLAGAAVDGAHDAPLVPLRDTPSHVHHHQAGLRHRRLDLLQCRLDRLHAVHVVMVAAGRIAAALLQYTIIRPAFDTDVWISSSVGWIVYTGTRTYSNGSRRPHRCCTPTIYHYQAGLRHRRLDLLQCRLNRLHAVHVVMVAAGRIAAAV